MVTRKDVGLLGLHCFIPCLLLYAGKSRKGYNSPQPGSTPSLWERLRSVEAICPEALAVAATAHPSLCAWSRRGASGGDARCRGWRRGTLSEVAGRRILPVPAT